MERSQQLYLGTFHEPHIETSVLEDTRYMHDITISTRKQNLLPGTIDRQHAEGFPWGDKPAEQVCDSLMELTECLNKRLRTRRRRKTGKELQSVALEGRDLVLCHLDLAPRNWLILKDGHVALLDLQQRMFMWPSNGWPKDPFMKELGRWNQINCLEGLEGFCLALFTRALGWKKEEIDVFVALVAKDFRDRKNSCVFSDAGSFWA